MIEEKARTTYLARVNRKYCESLFRAYNDQEGLSQLKDEEVTWEQDYIEISLCSAPGWEITIIKQRSGGAYTNKRHAYYIKTENKRVAEELVSNYCSRRFCLRWMPAGF